MTSLVATALVFCVGCNKGETAAPTASIDGGAQAAASSTDTPAVANAATAKAARPKPKENLFPEVVIKTSEGAIRVRLNAAKAPVTVDNFLANYVRRGFYNDTIVHYVAVDKMVIAGGFTADFMAKDAGAPILNEATNGLKNKRGTIAMVRDPEYSNTATSQFFFNLADNADLDHQSDKNSEDYGYCVFGEVIEGMEIVDAIAKTEVHDQGDFVSTPVKPIVIESVEQVK
jgi:cyclophilin family peptidyl-prolyl cis-trans isomerase